MESSKFQIKIEGESNNVEPKLYDGSMDFQIPDGVLPQGTETYAKNILVPLTVKRVEEIKKGDPKFNPKEAEGAISSYEAGITIANSTKKE